MGRLCILNGMDPVSRLSAALMCFNIAKRTGYLKCLLHLQVVKAFIPSRLCIVVDDRNGYQSEAI